MNKMLVCYTPALRSVRGFGTRLKTLDTSTSRTSAWNRHSASLRRRRAGSTLASATTRTHRWFPPRPTGFVLALGGGAAVMHTTGASRPKDGEDGTDGLAHFSWVEQLQLYQSDMEYAWEDGFLRSLFQATEEEDRRKTNGASAGSFSFSMDDIMRKLRRWKQTDIDPFFDKANRDPGSRVVAILLGTNLAIFSLWLMSRGSVKFENWMIRNFTLSVDGIKRGRLHTIVTSNFSQRGLIHFGLNAYVLWNFGEALVSPKHREYYAIENFLTPYQKQVLSPDMSPGRFLSLYTVSAITSSFASLAFHAATRTPHIRSLGASGAILGLVSAFCLLHPERRVSVMGIEMSTTTAFYGNLVINGVGAVAGLRRRTLLPIDWAGHLGGSLAAWAYWQLMMRE